MNVDFYDLKGCIENIFDDLKVPDCEFSSHHHEPFLHPGKACGIYSGNRLLGFLGEIHPDVLSKMDLKNPALVFEMDMEALAECFAEGLVCKDLPKFPSITRDVALLVQQDLEAEKMLRIALRAHKELLEKVSIFDVYCGKGIPHGMKSLGLRFSYRAPDRTLTDDEVSHVHNVIVKSMVDITGAKIRGEENSQLDS
jgi:phenylalanyl-tRNA synthetase beta chain